MNPSKELTTVCIMPAQFYARCSRLLPFSPFQIGFHAACCALQVLNITESEAIVKLSDGEMKVLDKGIIGLLHGAAA